MSNPIPKGPFFVPPYKPPTGGVDFLGLRQANLDMMAGCLPGINNVTKFIRPFSVLCWIYWKFYNLSEAAGEKKVSSNFLEKFQEKSEILFTWGHILQGLRGIPGIESKPPKPLGQVELSFKAWKRKPDSTSLMAPIQYGPASKTTGGLGFLEPLPNKFFKTRGEGVNLAEAIDRFLKSCNSYDILENLDLFEGTKKEARSLFSGWRVDKPSRNERAVFRRAFFDEVANGSNTNIGRRSSTVSLVLRVLRQADCPLSESDIRKAMAYKGINGQPPLLLAKAVKPAWYRWVILQTRQAQRLAFESLLSWTEQCIIDNGKRDSHSIVDAAMKSIEEAEETIGPGNSPQQIIDMIFYKIEGHESLIERAVEDKNFCIFHMINVIENDLKGDGQLIVPYAIRTLFICSKIVDYYADNEIVKPEIDFGGAERISLGYWRNTLGRLANKPMKEFLLYIIENLIISQHLGVAASRYDGGTQRLRITIEEEGLISLVHKPWHPIVTPDRLHSALSLMSDCRMINVDRENNLFTLVK